MWSGLSSACPHSHRKESEMPILFRWALRPQCILCRRKIAVCWAHSCLQLGQGVPGIWFSFFQSPWNREWRSVLASVGDRVLCLFVHVCLLLHFLSVPYEQASTGGIPDTELSAWHGRSARPGSSGLDQLS